MAKLKAEFPRYLFHLLLLLFVAVLLFLLQKYQPGNLYSKAQAFVWNQYQYWGAVFSDRQPLVFVVQIDNKSIEAVQRLPDGDDWPWPRQRYAELLAILFEHYQVGVVGIDIFMPYTRDEGGNDALLQLARRYPIVFSQVFDFNEAGAALRTGRLAGGITPPDAQQFAFLPQANGYLGLNKQLAQTGCVGHISPIKDDSSGMITHVQPLIAYEDKFYPMLAVEILRCQSGGKYNLAVEDDPNGKRLTFKDLLGEGGDVQLLLDESGAWRIPFRFKSSKFIAIPAIDVLQRRVDPAVAEVLTNGIVVLAGTAPGLGDQHPTPLAASDVGVAVHLQILEWLLDDKTVLPSFSLDGVAWLGALLLVLGLPALLYFNVGVGVVIAVALLTGLGWLLFGLGVWQGWHWFMPIHPAAVALAFLVLGVPIEWRWAQRTSGRLRKLFQGYLPTQLVGHIVNDNRQDLLLSRKRCLTLLFADIANFTQRAERMSPEGLAELTRQILERLTEVAHRHDGTVDKYMGDAVMVFWNAPFDQPDHADRAVAAALGMMETIAAFNREGSTLLQNEPIEVRIGVHTGEVVVGDLGTSSRHAYTAIGDAVNVTSRLQALAREQRLHLLVSKQTVDLLQRDWRLVRLGENSLRGRRGSVDVYTLSS